MHLRAIPSTKLFGRAVEQRVHVRQLLASLMTMGVCTVCHPLNSSPILLLYQLSYHSISSFHGPSNSSPCTCISKSLSPFHVLMLISSHPLPPSWTSVSSHYPGSLLPFTPRIMKSPCKHFKIGWLHIFT